MILLRQDCLVFKTAGGDQIPCSAQEVTIELMGESIAMLDPELVKNAAHAVLHYFKTDLGRTTVSVAEFSEALEKVLRGLGLKVNSAPKPPPRVVETDLHQLVGETAESCELIFFPRLRQELHRQLEQAPQIVRFRGLHGCVKQLTGAKRWTKNCQTLNDQIIEYLRSCLRSEIDRAACALVVL